MNSNNEKFENFENHEALKQHSDKLLLWSDQLWLLHTFETFLHFHKFDTLYNHNSYYLHSFFVLKIRSMNPSHIDLFCSNFLPLKTIRSVRGRSVVKLFEYNDSKLVLNSAKTSLTPWFAEGIFIMLGMRSNAYVLFKIRSE